MEEILIPEEIILPEQILGLSTPTGPKILYCQFSTPLKFDGTPATIKTDLWNYAEMNCYSISTLELIQNTTTGSEFYVSKTYTYGDALVILFLTLFLIFFIAKEVFNFFWKK